MKVNKKNISKVISTVLILLYVVFGLFIYCNDIMIPVYLSILFLPIVIGYGIGYATNSYFLSILVIILLMFLIWYVIYIIIDNFFN